ncbi:LacI family DNA-binding transcriptional regulator [candidate division KSB1 bacterium]|nr:LacI family DNA-binding transcriptional regulator [candidate division KSB1 bacterium]
MNITIGDVARMANVSKGTVSAVLNDKNTVSEATRKKVLAVIEKLNYRPNQVARSLSIRQTKSIGLVIKEIDNPYFAKVMKGVFDVCVKSGYTVLLGSSELDPEQERQSVDTLRNQQVDGLILSPLHGENQDFTYLAELLRFKYPLVMLEPVQNFTTNVVSVDNVQAAYRAISYLIELGHTDIAYFAGPQYSAHSENRLEGYRQALIDHNIPIRKDLIIQAGSNIEDGYRTGTALFSSSGDKPTAVFCYNDLVAVGLVDALVEMGIGIPEQVSVIGFDDIAFCESARIPLTTVHMPTYEIGEAAATLLINQILVRDKVLNEKIVLDAHLVKRQSCGPKK